MEKILMPGWAPRKRFAFGQSSADLARTAIAIERYRLARGNFPNHSTRSRRSSLPKSARRHRWPVFEYRRTSDGQFVLYSIGWTKSG